MSPVYAVVPVGQLTSLDRILRLRTLFPVLKSPTAIFIMGPTASGKTDLAVELVRRFPCDIVSVDSTLVYRDMDIGTAKPGPEILTVAPHRLIDILDPAESYSAARFCADAQREMAAITATGRTPLLVGGTMLYFRAMQQGLSVLPSADAAVRAQLEKEAERVGWAALHRRLGEVDPQAALRIHPNDPQRIQRALEVYELTGQPLSILFATTQERSQMQGVIKIVVAPSDRDILRQRVAARFHQMLARGLIDEIEALYKRGDLHRDLPSMRSVGYRQGWEYLAGEIAYSKMIERAIIATSQLAKRQMTWLRREEGAQWFDSFDGERVKKVTECIGKTMS